jgi:hypothetical protein
MGVVYLAEGPFGTAAITAVRPELASDPDFRSRFNQAVQACLRVRGPFTVELLDADTLGEPPWLATRYIPAPNLEQLVERYGPLRPEVQLALALGLAHALGTLHAAGVVHGDLKAADVRCPPEGPKVIGFGFGVAGHGQRQHNTGPEADIYAWGCILGYAATGRRPGRPPAVDPAAVAPPLRWFLTSATAEDPAQRPTARELTDRLSATLSGAVGGAVPGTDQLPGIITGRLLAAGWTGDGNGSAAVGGGSRLSPYAAPGSPPPGFGPPGPGPFGLPPNRPAPRRRGKLIGAITVGTAAVIALVVAVALTLGGSGSSPTVQRSSPPLPGVASGSGTMALRDAATAAGRDFAKSFLTFDYRDADSYISSITDRTTGAFRADFTAKTGELRSTLAGSRSVATGTVLAAAPRDVTAGNAIVLVAEDQQLTNTSTPSPRTVRQQLRLTLRLVDGTWLTSDLIQVTGGSTPCDDSSLDLSQQQALSYSCRLTAQAFSFDYRRLDAQFAAIEPTLTGGFADQFRQTAAQIRPLATKQHAVTVATVSDAAVESGSDDTVSVLLYLDQAVSSDSLSAPSLDRSRVRVQMQRDSNTWLIAAVSVL